MNNPHASGSWLVSAGQEKEFVRRWLEFLEWTRSSFQDLRSAHLFLDSNNSRRFISFSGWNSAEAMKQWRSSPGFADKFGECRALCDDFQGSDFTLAAKV